jgi:hypothetical protein
MASEEYENQRNSLESTAAWAVKISFPAFDDLIAKDFYWSSTEMEVDGDEYDQMLESVPRGRHQRDRGNDYAEFSVINPNNATYNEFYEYEHLIEKAEVVIKECYEISTGYFESEIRFFGYLKDFSLEEASLKFTAMSDLSRTGFLVGGRVITRERCGANFNVDGLLAPASPDWDICGWQTIQGGNPAFCTKYADGVDGCKAHNNFHRFFAIKGLSKADVEIVNTNPSGFDYQTDSSCFAHGTMVVMSDWTLKHIQQIKRGDVVLTFDVFSDRLIHSEVLSDVFIHNVQQYEKMRFEDESGNQTVLKVTKEHLFYLGNAIFAPVAALWGRTVQGITRDEKRSQIVCVEQETVYESVEVYNFHTKAGTYLVTNQTSSFFWKVHNSKSHTTVQV